METDNNKMVKEKMPIVYSCSGCSNIAQLANNIAVKMDREGLAEMSCIAGVGGNVKPIVQKAKSGREIIAIDGCILQCAKSCLKNINIEPDKHYILTDYGMKKEYHKDYDDESLNEIFKLLTEHKQETEILCEAEMCPVSS